MKQRQVTPELLDYLAPQDPRAVASRRDLRRINACMGNARAIAQALGASAQRSAPRRIVDLGAGDGSFLLRCLRRVPELTRGTVHDALDLFLVDRASAGDPEIMRALARLGCRPRYVHAEVGHWLTQRPAESGTWAISNLFLHHYADEELRGLLRLMAGRVELFCACEPRRGWLPWAASRLLVCLGANAITRHDATVSVRAGFTGRELSARWPSQAGWRIREERAGLWSHLFVAQAA